MASLLPWAFLLMSCASGMDHRQGYPTDRPSCSTTDEDATTLLQSVVRIPEKPTHDFEEKQVFAMMEKGHGRRQGKGRNKEFSAWELGKKFCIQCKQHAKKGGYKFAKQRCEKSKAWPKQKVKLDNSRRRVEGGRSCFALSLKGQGLTRGYQKRKRNEHKDSRGHMCRCLDKLLHNCKDSFCLKRHICKCQGMCAEFKKSLGCDGVSFLGAARESDAVNVSERMSLSNRARNEIAVDSDLDTSAQGKCAE